MNMINIQETDRCHILGFAEIIFGRDENHNQLITT